MGLSANLFFDLNDAESLPSKILLTIEQIYGAKEKKDKLLEVEDNDLTCAQFNLCIAH